MILPFFQKLEFLGSYNVCGISRRNDFKAEECETPENLDFLRNDKMVISVKIRNFYRSRMAKRTSPLESSHEI